MLKVARKKNSNKDCEKKKKKKDHKLFLDTVDMFFNSHFLNYALLKERGLVIVETV